MASPFTVTTVPSVVAVFNRNRNSISFQNTGANIVYVKKQVPGFAANNPSATNYDFALEPLVAATEIVQFQTSASFIAVTGAATSTLAVMETSNTTIV
jgi:hypothetical protein